MPASFDETFDYLTLFGLDPANVAVQPLDEVQEAVRRKKKDWTAQAINPLYQQQARANLERARQFETLLAAPDALPAYLGYQSALQAERRELQSHAAFELLSHALSPGRTSISIAQRELLKQACEERGISADVLEGVISSRGLQVVEDEPGAAGPGLPYQQPALDRALFSQIAGHLRLLGKESFYELLDLPSRTPPARVMSIARMQFDRWSKALPKTSECVAWEKSLQACLTYLKDDEGKARYDRALFNRRLDDFLWRVDLRLASGRFTREDFAHVAQVGVRDFGLTNETVNQCVRVRAAAKGLSFTKPLQIVVQTAGLARCLRCFRYTEANRKKCLHCGSTFDEVCRNPACGQIIAPGAKTCGTCGLEVRRGAQYAELLRLADMRLNSGDPLGALESYKLARRILESPALDELASRAARLRKLVASIREGASSKRWARVERELQDLASLAPRFSRNGLPTLEEVSRYILQLKQRLAALPEEVSPEEEARTCLELLSQWSDCEEVVLRLYRLAGTLENAGSLDLAEEIVRRLLEREPLSDDLHARQARLAQQQSVAREHTQRVSRLVDEFRQSMATDRLYAAERFARELAEIGAAEPIADAAPTLRARLLRSRAELDDVRQGASAGLGPDQLLARYLEILEHCRDCREALAAIQTLQPEAPNEPLDVRVTIHGTRRVLSWRPPEDGSVPTAYVVQRSVQPARGGRQAEAEWRTLTETLQPRLLDDEVLHSGSIVRYSVAAVRRGTLAIGGSVLQEFSVSSAPAFAPALLLWQEVLGLKARLTGEQLELHWHTPAGARQVLVESWTGGRDDRPDRPDALPPATGSKYLPHVGGDAPRCYRVYCVYDAPEGEFMTPGTCVTVAPGEAPQVAEVPAAAPESAETPPEFDDVLTQAPVAGSREANPLKRLGLWPPPPKKN